MKKLITIVALMLAMTATAQNYELIKESDAQKTEYRDGKQVMTITKDGITLSVTMSKEKNDYGTFYQSCMSIKNGTGETFTFSPEDIEVKVVDKYGEVNDLGVYTSDSYSKKVRRNQNWDVFLSQVVDAVASGGNSMSATQGVTAKAAQRGELRHETNGYLTKNTLHPDDTLAGFVNIGYNRGRVLLVRIPVNGQTFDMKWKLK